ATGQASPVGEWSVRHLASEGEARAAAGTLPPSRQCHPVLTPGIPRPTLGRVNGSRAAATASRAAIGSGVVVRLGLERVPCPRLGVGTAPKRYQVRPGRSKLKCPPLPPETS